MKKVLCYAIFTFTLLISITSCQENQRQKYYDKLSGDVTGYKLKGYSVCYEIDFEEDSYYMSTDQYPVYSQDGSYYIEIDGEKELLYKLDEPVSLFDEYKSLRYVTDGGLYVEKIPSGY